MTKREQVRLGLIALSALAFFGCSGGSGSSAGDPVAATGNRAPVAVTDVIAASGGTLMVPVLANDFDPDGDALSIVLVGAPGHGTTTVDDAGTPADGRDDYIVYTPATDYTGADTFSYTVTDGADGRATGDVQITAIPSLNALDKTVSTPMSTPIVIDVLDHPSVSIVSATVPAFGTVSIDDGGSPADMTDDYLVYTPVAGYSGPDTFFYTLIDPNGTDMAAVNVDVTASPSPPVPPNVHGQVAKGLLRNAIVQLYSIGPGGNRVGVPVAATTTDAAGRWSLSLPAARPALLVVASGGSYEDETRSTPSRTIHFGATDKLVAVLSADDDFVVSSIFTNALYLRARHIAGGSGFDTAYALARADSLTAWGFDISATETADPGLPDPTLPDISRMHAMALGGAATALDQIVTAVGLDEPNGHTIGALIDDLAECALDGNGFDGPIQVTVDGINHLIPADLDLDVEILRFRNNNFTAYAGTPLATWNAAACTATAPPASTQPPIVTVGRQRVSAPSPALSGSIDDPAAVVRITVDGRTYTAVNTGNAWRLEAGTIAPALTDGVYEVVAQAFDAAGNIGTDATSVELVVDATAPVVTVDTIKTDNPSPALSGTVDDPGATVVVTLDGADYSAIVVGTSWSLPAGSISPGLTEGSFAIAVTATDSLFNVATITVAAALTVSVNDPPVFDISGDVTADENFTGARLVTVSPDPVPPDEAGQVVTYSLNPAGADFADVTIDANTGTVFITSQPDAIGSQQFTIIADDGQANANFASRTFTLTVNPVNNPPAFLVSGDIVENQDFAGTRSVAVTPLPVPPDEAAQTVTYSLSPASVAFANIALDPATGQVSITAVAGATGSQLFTLTADDGQPVNNTASATFTLTVNATATGNVVPVITGQTSLSTPEELPLAITLANLVVSDPDNSYPADFSLSVQPGANYTVAANTITPVTDFVGSLSVPVIVNDGASSSALYNLNVTVSAINDAPVFSVSGNIVETEDFAGDRVVTVTPGPVPADETAQVVTYSLSPASVGFANVALDTGTGTVTVSAVADQSGSQVFTLTADDGGSVNSTASRTFTLSVSSNFNPTTSGIVDVDVLEDSAPVIVDLFAAFDDAEDADADMTYSVFANTNPALFDTLAVDGVAGTLTLDFAADVNGSATLTLRATDSGGDSVDAIFDVNVNAQSDLRIASLSPSETAPGIGRRVQFTLVLTNDGPSTATDVTVSVPLPAGYTYLAADNPSEYNEATGQWYRSAVNGTATLVLTAEVNAAGPYDVTAEVIAVNEPDPDSTPGNAIATEDDQLTTSTTPLPVTDLLLSITVDDPIPAPGSTVVLTVSLENHGPFDATGITVSLPPLPGQLTYESATPSAGAFDLATGVWDGFGVAWSGDPALPLVESVDITARVDAAVPLTTVLEALAELADLDQYEPDGTEQDTVAMLVLGDGLDHSWLGGAGPDPTDWENPANWSSNLVPSPGDNVTIGPTANDPVLNAHALSLATLDVESGAMVWANGFTISTIGDLDARDGPINGPGLVRLEFGRLRGTVPDLEVAAASPTIETEFDGDVVVNGDLVIGQGRIDTSRHTVWVNGNLLSTGSGILLQKEGPSKVIVAGDVTFDGADYSQKINGRFPLRNGELRVGGDFVQTGHPHSFAAEDKHLVIFDGPGPQSIYFRNPDNSNPEPDEPASSGSRFAHLRIDKDAETSGAVTLLSDVVVLRQLEQPLTYLPRIDAASGSGHVLMIGGADLDGPSYPQTRNIVFDNVPVHIFQGHDLAHLEGLVFTNMDPSVVQLRFERTDFGGPNDLVATTFETLPDFAAGGRYILFENIHPDPTRNRTLEVLQSLPAYGEPMTEVVGNANILWGTGVEDSDRDGITDADEYTSGTNPFTPDSDGDGIDDPTELAMGTDPFDFDSDGDGVGDGAERAAGGDPLTAAAPGTILYVRPAPLGDDANSGFGGWSDALATNAAVEAALLDGAGPGQPFYVLYDAGVYAPLEIDRFDNVSLVGSVGPGVAAPVTPPTTIFDAGGTPDVAVIRVIDSAAISIQAMTLTGASNFAGGGDGSLGGGLYVNDSSTVSLTDMVIENNVAADFGGGIYVADGGRLDLIDSRVWRNAVPSGGFGGGGIASIGGLNVTRTIIADNRYGGGNNSGGGGGIYLEAGADPVSIRDSRILSNFSDTNGGGIFLWNVNTPVSIFNNLLAGNANESQLGGAIYAERLDRGWTTLIASNTIAFNRSIADADSAGGIHVDRADDAQLRDNILWFNVDGDTDDELQDQYFDERDSAPFEFNSFQSFGPDDLFGNSSANPRFELGFYLRSDSSVDDRGSTTAIAAGLDLPYTTVANGAADAGLLDLGFHYLQPANGEAYAVRLVDQIAVCATDRLTMYFVVDGVGGELGPGHVVAVRQDGSDTAGGTLNTLTGIEPFGWSDSELAIDEGDGVYRVAIDGVSHSAGEIAVLEIKIDNDNTFELSSSDLTVLFGGDGC